ncbi:MAG: prohibitin family protein [candidate division KSB1 bacterium]|nr:prohibitin family protein [candidate division KSB1 bacterium]MDZ7302361.1 prohibitin family protein [candidate division KSB1 bacterium]MDZ7311213.1 prohibitin family protein [candidate division KSB1 bacterium]
MSFIVFLAVAIIAFVTYFASRKRFMPTRGQSTAAGIAPVIGVLALLAAVVSCLTVVPAGHVGVVDFFGMVSPNTLKAGINLVNPLANVIKFSVKTQEIKEVMDVPSKEGLTVQLEVSVLYHLNPEKAAEVYKTIGPNYAEIILEPQFRSVSRGVTAMYEAKALYTSERELLASQIQEHLSKMVEPRGITVETTPLRRVGLPTRLSESIEEKLRADQESQRMEFVLTKEKQEAERKRIEAQGIADFQKIVAQGLNDQYLRWKGIEATEKLANSQNSKIVIVGSGKDGLPLILGGQ